MPRSIQITRSTTVAEIEDAVSHIGAGIDELEVWLPRELGPQFFKETWLVAFMLSAARRSSVVVRDWVQEEQSDQVAMLERYCTTIEGAAATIYGRALVNASGHTLRCGESEVASHLIAAQGLLETRPGLPTSAKSLTICALDPSAPEPLAFAGVRSKEGFVAEFLDLKRDYLDRSFGLRAAKIKSPTQAEKDLATFAYEIFHNSLEHGRFGDDGTILKGVRFLRLRKHIDYDADKFVERASGFPELATYLSAALRDVERPAFYEVSISDHGLGLIRRFLSTRPDFPPPEDTPTARTALVNTIIEKNLSSKVNQTGAGFGLRRALAAVAALRGFLSVRTDSIWLHSSQLNPKVGDASKVGYLSPVTRTALPYIAGTHFSMLFPVR